MALNTFKCNHVTPLHFKGLLRESVNSRQVVQEKWLTCVTCCWAIDCISSLRPRDVGRSCKTTISPDKLTGPLLFPELDSPHWSSQRHSPTLHFWGCAPRGYDVSQVIYIFILSASIIHNSRASSRGHVNNQLFNVSSGINQP